jgi:hypothetical protein
MKNEIFNDTHFLAIRITYKKVKESNIKFQCLFSVFRVFFCMFFLLNKNYFRKLFLILMFRGFQKIT